jgi:C4-dicarboxylate-binding protein DctP
VVTNKKFWDGLPADVRTQLEKAMAEATKYSNEISEKENAEALDAMKKSGKTEFITLTPAQKANWKKALQPVYEDAAKRVGKSLIDEFEKEVAGAATN